MSFIIILLENGLKTVLSFIAIYSRTIYRAAKFAMATGVNVEKFRRVNTYCITRIHGHCGHTHTHTYLHVRLSYNDHVLLSSLLRVHQRRETRRAERRATPNGTGNGCRITEEKTSHTRDWDYKEIRLLATARALICAAHAARLRHLPHLLPLLWSSLSGLVVHYLMLAGEFQRACKRLGGGKTVAHVKMCWM